MGLFERCAAVALCCAAIAACNEIAGLGDFQDVPCEPCAEAGSALEDSSPFPDDSTSPINGEDAGADGASDDATLDASKGTGGDDAEAGPIATPDGASSVDLEWPRWIMPNAAEAGLPNPASYVGINDAGAFDTITNLLWSPQFSATTIAQASAACAFPARVPTRIELVSILDTSQSSPPFVNPVFRSMPSAQFWTSSTTPDGRWWTVNFATGVVTPSPTASAAICVLSVDGGIP